MIQRHAKPVFGSRDRRIRLSPACFTLSIVAVATSSSATIWCCGIEGLPTSQSAMIQLSNACLLCSSRNRRCLHILASGLHDPHRFLDPFTTHHGHTICITSTVLISAMLNIHPLIQTDGNRYSSLAFVPSSRRSLSLLSHLLTALRHTPMTKSSSY